MANPHNGEVTLDLSRATKKGIIKPKDRSGKNCHLKFNLGTLGEAEFLFKGDTSVFEVMQRDTKNPVKISTRETIILLQYGLMHQFPGMSYELASQILDEEDFIEIRAKISEAVNLAFHGTKAFQEGMDEAFITEETQQTLAEGEEVVEEK